MKYGGYGRESIITSHNAEATGLVYAESSTIFGLTINLHNGKGSN